MNGDKDADDDALLFHKAMAGTNRSHRNYEEKRNNDYDQRKKPTAKITPKKNVSTRATEPAAVDETNQGDFVLFARPGLQRKVIKRLKRGDYPYDAVLDLHGMRTHEAGTLLSEFLSDAILNNLSCVLIIHGKGYHSENNKGVLKPYTISWLKESAEIKAFCSAHPKDGGTGAVYVLLKRRLSPSD